jgi:uncharacterized protein DUF3810
MGVERVKLKVPISVVLFALAAVTFLASWLELFPREWVETQYSRRAFPTISHVFGLMGDAIPVSWLDLWILVCIGILIYCVYRRRWKPALGTAAVFYLWFFWGWGLNYHRPPVASRLHLDAGRLDNADLVRFAETAAGEINRLWPLASKAPLGRDEISTVAAKRVERVVFKIDGTDWVTSARVKRTLIMEPWYRSAGIDGVFNPFGHEALVIQGPYPFELPFLMSHELAHARGIANEGEANLVALFATVASEDPRFQYSGWLHLWGYLRHSTEGLDPGPKADLLKIAERIFSNQISAISNVQSAILDAHLKANAVPGGIRSYSDFVKLAIASQPRWKEFE